MRVRRVLDNAKQTLVRSLSDNNSLVNGLVTAKRLDGLLGLVLGSILVDLECWVHGIQIWACRRSGDSASLGGNGVDHVGLGHKHTSILLVVVGVQEDVRSVDVNDLTLALLSGKLLDNILQSDL